MYSLSWKLSEQLSLFRVFCQHPIAWMTWLIFIINFTWPKLSRQEGSLHKELSFSGWPIVGMTALRGNASSMQCLSSEAQGSQYTCYSSEGKGMLTAGSQGKSRYTTNLTQEIYRKVTKVWLPWLRWQETGNWAGNRFIYRISWGLSFSGWGLVGFPAQGLVNFQNPEVSSDFYPYTNGLISVKLV